MQLIVLSPNLDLIFSPEQRKILETEFNVSYYTQLEDIDTIIVLQSEEPKIVAIDPDFCDWKLTRENLEKMENIVAICLQTTSFHYLDTKYLSTINIPVTNLRGFSTNAVAEQAIMMTFALARRLPIIIQDDWKTDFEKFRWFELRDKRVGIIWMGNIGKRIAELAHWIGMDISYWSREARDDRFRYKDLSDLLTSSEVLYYTLAANEETENFFSGEITDSINPHAIFVSIVHMQQKLFIDLVKSQKLAWYACDDFIWSMNDFKGYNILPWTNAAWCTTECFKRNGEQWLEAIMYAKQWEFPNKVN